MGLSPQPSHPLHAPSSILAFPRLELESRRPPPNGDLCGHRYNWSSRRSFTASFLPIDPPPPSPTALTTSRTVRYEFDVTNRPPCLHLIGIMFGLRSIILQTNLPICFFCHASTLRYSAVFCDTLRCSVLAACLVIGPGPLSRYPSSPKGNLPKKYGLCSCSREDVLSSTQDISTSQSAGTLYPLAQGGRRTIRVETLNDKAHRPLGVPILDFFGRHLVEFGTLFNAPTTMCRSKPHKMSAISQFCAAIGVIWKTLAAIGGVYS